MTPDDPVARLIPWYAAGTLDPDESTEVEAHLSGCDPCRDLLALARGFRRLAPHVSRDMLFDHVQAQRLVEFAADPLSLESDARRFVTTHARGCAPCAEALEILEDIGRAPASTDDNSTFEAGARPARGRLHRTWMGVWRRLSRTVLHPVPAFVYLLAVVLVLFILPRRAPGPGAGGGAPPMAGTARPAASFIPPVFDLPGEISFRSGQTPPAPAIVPLAADAGSVALALVTDIDSEDLGDPGVTFRVEIAQEGRLLFAASRRGSDFDRRGRLTLLLDPATVTGGVPCLIRVILVKPGDARDGEEVYRRAFVFAPPTPPGGQSMAPATTNPVQR